MLLAWQGKDACSMLRPTRAVGCGALIFAIRRKVWIYGYTYQSYILHSTVLIYVTQMKETCRMELYSGVAVGSPRVGMTT